MKIRLLAVGLFLVALVLFTLPSVLAEPAEPASLFDRWQGSSSGSGDDHDPLQPRFSPKTGAVLSRLDAGAF